MNTTDKIIIIDLAYLLARTIQQVRKWNRELVLAVLDTQTGEILKWGTFHTTVES
jgi:hypothetical protein